MGNRIDLKRAAEMIRDFYLERQRPPSYEEVRRLFRYRSKNAAFWLVENILAACTQVADDLDGDLIGDFFASAEYRKAMASVEIRHALFHITGEAHIGSRAEWRGSDSNDPVIQSTESEAPDHHPVNKWWQFWKPRR